MLLPIVIVALGTIPKGFEKEQEDLEIHGRIGAIQTTALLRPNRILGSLLETRGDSLTLRLQ